MDGETVGDVRFIAQVLDAGDDGTVATIIHSLTVHTLPEGTIHSSGLFRIEVATDDEAEPLGANVLAVIGGSGAYAGASGQDTVTFEPGELIRHDFDLQCD